MKISYECTEIIEELKQDIAEFGADHPAWAVILPKEIRIPFTDKTKTVYIMVNYLSGETPPSSKELMGGQAQLSTLGELLPIFEEQNRIC